MAAFLTRSTLSSSATPRRAGALLVAVLCALALPPAAARADNPIVQTIYTADPAPLVHNGRVYLYTGHDEDGSTYFTMKDWRVCSSADMVNWTDHGSPMSLATFSWADADAWAGQAVYRNGKFYWYVPVREPADRRGWPSASAVADSPTGPVPRRHRPSAGRERRDRPHGLHRRRRPGLPVLGQPQPVVRQAQRRHDLLLGQPHPDPAHHGGLRHPHRRRQPAHPLRGGAVGLQAQRPVLQRVRRQVLLGVHRLLDRPRPHRAVDLPGHGHAHAGRQLHQPRRRSSTSRAARTSSTTTAPCRAAAVSPARWRWRSSPTTPTARSRPST